MQNIDFKEIDSTDFQALKPIILLFYNYYNKNLINNDNNIQLLTTLELENKELYDMLKTFGRMLKSSHQGEVDINKIVYLLFRKFYIDFNRKHNELKSINEDCELNQKKFQHIENIVSHISNINNQFKDTENLNGSQYYLVIKVKEFEKIVQRALNHHSSNKSKAEFKKEFEELRMIAPFIAQYIKILENNINRFLDRVNKVCNDTNMTQKLFQEYKESCKNLTLNLNKLKIDFVTENEIPKNDVQSQFKRQSEHKGLGER